MHTSSFIHTNSFIMRQTQVPRNALWQFHNKLLCCSYKSLFKSYVERHKTWPNQHNMTKLQSNMANVHFFPSMSMGFTNCSSGFNLTRTIVRLPDLSGSPHIPPLFCKFPEFAQNSKEQYWSVTILVIKKLTKLNQRSFKNRSWIIHSLVIDTQLQMHRCIQKQ